MPAPKTTAVRYIGSFATCTVQVSPGRLAEFTRNGDPVDVPADLAEQLVADGDFATGPAPRSSRKTPAASAAGTPTDAGTPGKED